MQITFSILQIPALHLQPKHQLQSGKGQVLLSLPIPQDGQQNKVVPDGSSKVYIQDDRI